MVRDNGQAGAGKEPVKRIEVFGRYWVELVVMATRAGNGQSLERFPDGVDLVVDHRDLFSLDVQGCLIELDESVETKADERFVAIQGIIPSRFDQIAGQMLLNKSLNRKIVGERADQIIAVSVREGQVRIVFGSVGLCVAHRIHPMPSPVFGVFGRLEHRIEGRLPSFVVGRWVEEFGNETLDFLDARWQASELIAQSTQERMRVGRAAPTHN